MHWLNLIARSDSYRFLLPGLIEFAKAKNITCLSFEGIETREKLKLAEQMGADYVQVFLFKDQFIQVQSKCRLLTTVVERSISMSMAALGAQRYRDASGCEKSRKNPSDIVLT